MSQAHLPTPIIDFHVHLFPDRLFEAIWKQFVIDYGYKVLHNLYYQECIEYLRSRGVGTIVYSNYAHRAGTAQRLNEWNIKALDEIDDLYCFAAYHPDDKNSLEMAAELLTHEKILGFKLQLLVQRFYPHDERLFPLYEMVKDSGKRIQMHVGTGPVGNEFVGAEHFKQLLQRYPDLPATICHMGALEYDEFGSLLDTHPDIYLDTSFSFLPELGGCFNLGKGFLEKNKDRILYGSDFPNVLFPREVEIETLLEFDLSQAFYNNVFRDNALKLINESTAKQ
jgi:uncharacterized protein